VNDAKDVCIVDAVRTPFGRYGGGLAGVRPDDLAAHAVREPLARTPGLAPVEAVNRAPAKAGKGFGDLSVLELDEAFAAQGLGCVAEWPEFDPAILDPQGGAVAPGHPLGASGARLAGTVAHQLARAGVGVGQGLALVPER
jgi:acetyl-CoA acetyltransferase